MAFQGIQVTGFGPEPVADLMFVIVFLYQGSGSLVVMWLTAHVWQVFKTGI